MQESDNPPPEESNASSSCVSTSDSAAIQQIEATCQLIAAGRIAATQLALHAKTSGLSETEFRLLWLLRSDSKRLFTKTEPSLLDQKAIGEKLGLSAAQVSAVVERLRKADLIAGQPSSTDRRRNVWQLTLNGTTLINNSVATFAASSGKLQVYPTLFKQEGAA